jgi:hypothetical protein
MKETARASSFTIARLTTNSMSLVGCATKKRNKRKDGNSKKTKHQSCSFSSSLLLFVIPAKAGIQKSPNPNNQPYYQ